MRVTDVLDLKVGDIEGELEQEKVSTCYIIFTWQEQGKY